MSNSGEFKDFLDFIEWMYEMYEIDCQRQNKEPISFVDYRDTRFFWLVEQFKPQKELVH